MTGTNGAHVPVDGFTGWTTTSYAPAGYIEVPERLSQEAAAEIRGRWADAQKDPSKPFILSGGARFVPFDAYAPQAVLSEAIEIEGSHTPILLLAIACIANAVAIVALAAALIIS